MKKRRLKFWEMSFAQYERWLKRNGYTGLAAFSMDQRRKALRKKHKLDE